MDDCAKNPGIPAKAYQNGIVRVVTKLLESGVRPPIVVRINDEAWQRLCAHITGSEAHALQKLVMKTALGPVEIVADATIEPGDMRIGHNDPKREMRRDVTKASKRNIQRLMEGKTMIDESGLRMVRG